LLWAFCFASDDEAADSAGPFAGKPPPLFGGSEAAEHITRRNPLLRQDKQLAVILFRLRSGSTGAA